MKVTTDGCLFGAWTANALNNIAIKKEILDVGTGTGLLSLMLAQKHSSVFIDALEIDEDAALQAQENIELFPLKNSIRVIHADVKHYPFLKKYDVILSNPPFYEAEIPSAHPARRIAHHQGGLLLSEVFSIIKSNLKPDGVFFVMLPYKRKNELESLIRQAELTLRKTCFVRQTGNHDFFRIFLAGCHLNRNIPIVNEFEEITILENDQQYTDEFKTLLKDYYLYL